MLRVGFIGAGGVNFGSVEGPWDHASRVERMENVKVVGISDPDTAKAEQVLQKRLNGNYSHVYTEASIRSSFEDMLKKDAPDVVFIGLPPHCHGLSEAPFNVECVCADYGVHMFVEKPISSYEPSRLYKTMEKIKQAREKGVITSVGYMFRYSKAVEKMKEIIKEEAEKRGITEGNHVTTVIAKYNCAYSQIDKASWWDMRSSGGPVVEQCTHFADLVRFISESECDNSTLTAYGIYAEDKNVGVLKDIIKDKTGTPLEENFPVEHRVPRSTTAMWKFESGALCQLTHGVQLNGVNYEAEIEVWADGLRMTLENPYTSCKLQVRRGRKDEFNRDLVETFEFDNNKDDPSSDPYYNEVKCFLDAVRTGDTSKIKSSYEDAFKTYELTWAIQNESSRNRFNKKK